MGIYNSNFDFNKYRAFYAVAECRSFSKATELLHISQPAVSKAVKDLEEQLDVKLFIRENKKVVLTDDGKKLMLYIKKAFDNILMAERSFAENIDQAEGMVKIGTYSHIAKIILPKLIKEFNNKYPKVTFDIYTTSTNECISKLKNNELDFVLLEYPIFDYDDSYNEEIIVELENCFFASKKYYDLYMKNKKDIVEYPLILPYRGYDDIDGLEKIFKNRNLILKPIIRVYATGVMKDFVKNDLGIGWGLKKAIKKDLDDKSLFEIPINFMNPKTKFSIAYNNDIISNISLEFINFMKDYIKNNKI